jgi:hypothetical protein
LLSQRLMKQHRKATGDLPLHFHPATTGARWSFMPFGAG